MDAERVTSGNVYKVKGRVTKKLSMKWKEKEEGRQWSERKEWGSMWCIGVGSWKNAWNCKRMGTHGGHCTLLTAAQWEVMTDWILKERICALWKFEENIQPH